MLNKDFKRSSWTSTELPWAATRFLLGLKQCHTLRFPIVFIYICHLVLVFEVTATHFHSIHFLININTVHIQEFLIAGSVVTWSLVFVFCLHALSWWLVLLLHVLCLLVHVLLLHVHLLLLHLLVLSDSLLVLLLGKHLLLALLLLEFLLLKSKLLVFQVNLRLLLLNNSLLIVLNHHVVLLHHYRLSHLRLSWHLHQTSLGKSTVYIL